MKYFWLIVWCNLLIEIQINQRSIFRLKNTKCPLAKVVWSKKSSFVWNGSKGPKWAQKCPKWSKTCYIDHLGPFGTLLDHIVPVQNSNSVVKTLDSFSSKWRQIYSPSWNLLNAMWRVCKKTLLLDGSLKKTLKAFLSTPRTPEHVIVGFSQMFWKLSRLFLLFSPENLHSYSQRRGETCVHTKYFTKTSDITLYKVHLGLVAAVNHSHVLAPNPALKLSQPCSGSWICEEMPI